MLSVIKRRKVSSLGGYRKDPQKIVKHGILRQLVSRLKWTPVTSTLEKSLIHANALREKV